MVYHLINVYSVAVIVPKELWIISLNDDGKFQQQHFQDKSTFCSLLPAPTRTITVSGPFIPRVVHSYSSNYSPHFNP